MGKNSVPKIEVPSIGGLTSQAVQASIGSLPDILKAFEQYGPQFSQAIGDLFLKQGIGRSSEFFPEATGAYKSLGDIVNQDLTDIAQGRDITPSGIRKNYEENIRSGQALRGMALSPISASTEAVQLAGLSDQYRNNAFTNAYNFLGAQNPAFQVPGALMEPASIGLTPIQPYQSAALGTELAGMQAQAQLGNYALQQQGQKNIFSSLGSLGGGIGSFFGIGGEKKPWYF